MAAGTPERTFHQINEAYSPALQRLTQPPAPPVFAMEGFLDAAECEALQQRATPFLSRAPVVQLGGKPSATPGAGARGRESFGAVDARTSETCFFSRESNEALLAKVCALTNKPLDCCELVQVGRYLHGQFYRPHFDAIDPHTELGREFIKNGGNRVITVLIYLNDVSSGGCTFFEHLGLRVQPKRGKVVVFFPSFANGEIDPQALHCAEDAEDEKWVSQIWIRQTTRTPGRPSDE